MKSSLNNSITGEVRFLLPCMSRFACGMAVDTHRQGVAGATGADSSCRRIDDVRLQSRIFPLWDTVGAVRRRHSNDVALSAQQGHSYIRLLSVVSPPGHRCLFWWRARKREACQLCLQEWRIYQEDLTGHVRKSIFNPLYFTKNPFYGTHLSEFRISKSPTRPSR